MILVNLFISSFVHRIYQLLLCSRWHHARFWGYKDKDVFKEFTVQCREKAKPKTVFSR